MVEDYDDEEADFAHIDDLLGNERCGSKTEGADKAMGTTAAFRMSTNDDLKKTANWSQVTANVPNFASSESNSKLEVNHNANFNPFAPSKNVH